MLAKLHPALIATAFSCAIAAVPAAAAVPADAVPSRAVSYRDLDLRTPEGVATLERRVRVATDRVCGRVDPRDSVSRPQILSCREVAMGKARAAVQVAVAATRADRQLAQAEAAPSIRLDAH